MRELVDNSVGYHRDVFSLEQVFQFQVSQHTFCYAPFSLYELTLCFTYFLLLSVRGLTKLRNFLHRRLQSVRHSRSLLSPFPLRQRGRCPRSILRQHATD